MSDQWGLTEAASRSGGALGIEFVPVHIDLMLQVFCPVEVLANQSAFVEGTMAAFHCAIAPGRMAWDQAVFNTQARPPQGQEGRKGSGGQHPQRSRPGQFGQHLEVPIR